MMPPPLFVMAASKANAISFVVHDLGDDSRRLLFVSHPDVLLKHPYPVIVHPTAPQHPYYNEIMQVIKAKGLLMLCVDESMAFGKALLGNAKHKWVPYADFPTRPPHR